MSILESNIGEKTTMKLFKEVMRDMFNIYPDYSFWRLFEKKLGKERGIHVINLLKKDELISTKELGGQQGYKLTAKGINFAIAMVNLEYSKQIHKFNKRIIFLTTGLFIIGVAQLILAYLQYWTLL